MVVQARIAASEKETLINDASCPLVMARSLADPDDAAIASARSDDRYLSVELQLEGDVIRVIARRLDDLSPMLASVGDPADITDVYRVSRADVVKHAMGPDSRDSAERPRDIYIPDMRLGSGIISGEPVEGIKVKTRDFR